ncbi:hypothetical protein AB6T38_17015 [Aliiglaciecola sp. SL4]|uniref:hypothetical protein n=1 Tax=Aliiglaciecola sp. SL4 TaxID=3239806 RepID=UPI00355B2C71
MKNFILAVLIAILITYSCGIVANEWFNFSIHFDEHIFGPMESVVGVTVIGAVMAIVGVVVAISVFGALALALFVAFVAMLFAGVTMFWPMLLVIAFIFWLVKDKRQTQY